MPPKKVSVRLMAPFSMQCIECGHFIYKSTKFNARKSGTGESYLGINIFQFSLRCSNCSAEIVLKTDPKAGDYQITKGAKRTLDQPLNEKPQRPGPDKTHTPELRAASPLSFRASEKPAQEKPAQLYQHKPPVHKDRERQVLGGGVRKQLPIPKRRKHLTNFDS